MSLDKNLQSGGDVGGGVEEEFDPTTATDPAAWERYFADEEGLLSGEQEVFDPCAVDAGEQLVSLDDQDRAVDERLAYYDGEGVNGGAPTDWVSTLRLVEQHVAELGGVGNVGIMPHVNCLGGSNMIIVYAPKGERRYIDLRNVEGFSLEKFGRFVMGRYGIDISGV